MAVYTPGNVCPENAGGHEPLQYNDPLKDAPVEIGLEFKDSPEYSARAECRICKHCGALYSTGVVDTLD